MHEQFYSSRERTGKELPLTEQELSPGSGAVNGNDVVLGVER